MMLTLGVRLRRDERAQRALIADLDGLGRSCLGFGVGAAFKDVPEALLSEARRRNFPVVRIPEHTRFGDVAAAVRDVAQVGTARSVGPLPHEVDGDATSDHQLSSVVRRLGAQN